MVSCLFQVRAVLCIKGVISDESRTRESQFALFFGGREGILRDLRHGCLAGPKQDKIMGRIEVKTDESSMNQV